MSRKIEVKNGAAQCPKCGNNRHFEIHSCQVGEDCCEVWASCVCGVHVGEKYRLEDVWGGTGDENCLLAMRCWNDWVLEWDGDNMVKYLRHKAFGPVLEVERYVGDDRVLFVGQTVPQLKIWYERASEGECREYLEYRDDYGEVTFERGKKVGLQPTEEWLVGVLKEHRDVTVPTHRRLWCKYKRKRDLRYFKHQRKQYKGVIRVVTNRVKERIKLGKIL